MSGQLQVLRACHDGQSAQLLDYILVDQSSRTQRMRQVLCTAVVAAPAAEACWLLRNCSTYLEPAALRAVLRKMAAGDHCTGINCLLSLKLELHPVPISDGDLLLALQTAARSGRQGATGLLLQACSEHSVAVAQAGRQIAMSSAAAGGHLGTLQTAMHSALEHGCVTSEATVRCQLQVMLPTARASVLVYLAGWALEHLGADGMAEYRMRLAGRAAADGQPRLCAQLVRYPELLLAGQQGAGSIPLNLAATAFMTALGSGQPANPGAASMAFAEQHLPNFPKQSKAALARCIQQRQRRVVKLLLCTPGVVQCLGGDFAALKRICITACKASASGCLDELFAAGRQQAYGLSGGSICSTKDLQQMAVDACSGDKHRVLASVLRELRRLQGGGEAVGGAATAVSSAQGNDTPSGQDAWSVRLGKVLASQLASGCVREVAALAAGSEDVWSPLLDALVLQWQKIAPVSCLPYQMVRLLLQLLRLAQSNAALHAQLEQRAQAVPWTKALQACLMYPEARVYDLQVLFNLTGRLHTAFTGTPDILIDSVGLTWQRDIHRCIAVLDAPRDTATDEERNGAIKKLMCSDRMRHRQRCALLGRMQGSDPLGDFSDEELREALSTACASGDEAFLDVLISRDKLRILPGQLAARTVEKALLKGACAYGRGPASQRMAAALLQAAPRTLQADLGRALELAKHGAYCGYPTMWLLRAYIYAPPEYALQWTAGGEPKGWSLPEAVCTDRHFPQQSWCSILPDLMACDAGRRHGVAILQACLAKGLPERLPLVAAVYRRVQWRGRRGAGLAGRRGVVLQRAHARAQQGSLLGRQV